MNVSNVTTNQSKDERRKRIIEMVKEINDQKSVNLVYGFVNRIYGEEKARGR